MTKTNMREDGPPFPMPQPRVFVRTQSFNCFDIYLDGPIESPEAYREEFQILETAGSGDLVQIHINTEGGDLFSILQWIDSVQNCEAPVVAIVEGKAFSAGSLLMCSCPEVVVKPSAAVMCHHAGYGAIGKASDIASEVEFMTPYLKDTLRKIYKHFLSDEEIVLLLKGEDFWFNAEETGRRLDAMFAAKDEEVKAEMERQKKEAAAAQRKPRARKKPAEQETLH